MCFPERGFYVRFLIITNIVIVAPKNKTKQIKKKNQELSQMGRLHFARLFIIVIFLKSKKKKKKLGREKA